MRIDAKTKSERIQDNIVSSALLALIIGTVVAAIQMKPLTAQSIERSPAVVSMNK